MARYLFTFHGGTVPETEQEIEKTMQSWIAWFEKFSSCVIDSGNPVGQPITVMPDGTIVDNGGSNPVSGYSMFSADSEEQAAEIAKQCPILMAGGSVEIAAIHEIP